jgi:hypothetical protein
MDREAIYRTFFHGESLKVLAAITFCSDSGLIAHTPPLGLPLGSHLPDPARARVLAREAAFQAAGAWLLIDGKPGLPVGVAAIHFFDRPASDEVVTLEARVRHVTAEQAELDVDIVGHDGRLIEALTGLSFRRLASY